MDDKTKAPDAVPAANETDPTKAPPKPAPEIGGRNGPDPVRYGDWEKGGIAVDF
jgi:hypothetical protein